MKDLLLNPVVAFPIYLALAALLNGLGRWLAASSPANSVKESTYASGEVAPPGLVGPGYRPFFVVALFFAILHLGILVLGSGGLNGIALVYLIGIMLALLALILG